MEPLYTLLRSEIKKFEKHVEDCRDSFDMVTLSRFLSGLTEQDAENVDSLQRVRHLANHLAKAKLPFKDSRSDIDNYISWLSAYMDYLRVLKEAFDDRIVIPLCENLYVNEDTESHRISSDSSNCSSPVSSKASSQKEWMKLPRTYQTAQPEVPMDSIPKIAKELFNVRRRWTLLLTNDTIKDEYFNPQSIADLCRMNTPEHLKKVLRLIPDIFYKCLLTADLSRQWLDLHECRYGLLNFPVAETKDFHTEGTTRKLCLVTAKQLSTHKEAKLMQSRDSQAVQTTSQESSEELDDVHCMKTRMEQEDLNFLVRREERLKTLEKETREAGFRVHDLLSQLELVKQENEQLQQRWDFEELQRTEEGVIKRKHRTNLRQMEELQRQLKLQKYRYRILEGDWMLELEIRPLLIRHMDTVSEGSAERRTATTWIK
ncbi:hypothetical protein scyTo_0025371 [Scyliorhinus torazame]|uniref:Uncharacterized protein n=1 Tax=Scyliorhinus torazame TaxID=75743 RepID=A0A401QH65_SCYTO|nr:hypothetical protein [Scyliorhinus torazame]